MGRPKGSKNKVSNKSTKQVTHKRHCDNVNSYGNHTSAKQRMIRKALRDVVVNTTSIALGVLIALLAWDGIWNLISK